jgi:hypothetical protein
MVMTDPGAAPKTFPINVPCGNPEMKELLDRCSTPSVRIVSETDMPDVVLGEPAAPDRVSTRSKV